MTPYCRKSWCDVPEPHRHRRPTVREVSESDEALVTRHPSHCAWRKDVYDGCSCGVTAAVTALYDLMSERPA